MGEFKAMGELARARQQLVVNMFDGTKLKFGTSSQLSTAKQVLSTGKKIVSSGNKLAKGGKAASTVANVPGTKEAVQDFIVQCADVDNIHEVIAAITGEVLANLVHEITPILGVVTSGVKLVKAGKAVAKDGYHLYKSDDYKAGFRLGDPSAAAEAIQLIIKRDLAKHSVQLGQQRLPPAQRSAGFSRISAPPPRPVSVSPIHWPAWACCSTGWAWTSRTCVPATRGWRHRVR
jgi:hypothetical protein